MIKIIKNTMMDPVEMKCDRCKSIFSFNYEDIQRRETDGMFFRRVDRFVICPVCKSENSLAIATIESEGAE